MRHPGRIKIVTKILKARGLGDYLFRIGAISIEMDAHAYAKTVSLVKLAEVWKKEPDLRLTQILVNYFNLENTPGFWYYSYEESKLIEFGWIDPRDILFWTSWYTKKGDKRDEPKHQLIRNLETDHIKKIFEWQERVLRPHIYEIWLQGSHGWNLKKELKLREDAMQNNK